MMPGKFTHRFCYENQVCLALLADFVMEIKCAAQFFVYENQVCLALLAHFVMKIKCAAQFLKMKIKCSCSIFKKKMLNSQLI